MKNVFKVGDVVRFNPEQIKQTRFVVADKDYVVVGIVDGFVRIINDKGREAGYFASRFLPLHPAAPKEIAPNGWVKSIRNVGVSIVKGNTYYVERTNPDKTGLKLKGVRNYVLSSSFVVCEAPPVDVIKSEQLLQELEEKTGGVAGTCSYVLSFTDGTKSYHIRDVCHARLRNYNNVGKTVDFVALNVSGHLNNHPYPEAYKAFVEYITQESPFKECFLPRKIEDILSSGVLLDVSKPYSRCVTSAVALRTGSEYPEQAKMFEKVVDAGFSSETALFVAGFFSENQKGSLVYNNNSGGHHFLSNDMSVEDLSKFMEEGFHRDIGEKSYVEDCTKNFVVSYAIADRKNGRNGYVENKLFDENKTQISQLIPKLKGVVIEKSGWSDSYVFKGKNALVKCAAAVCKYF